jgi:hypothetical protein
MVQGKARKIRGLVTQEYTLGKAGQWTRKFKAGAKSRLARAMEWQSKELTKVWQGIKQGRD